MSPGRKIKIYTKYIAMVTTVTKIQWNEPGLFYSKTVLLLFGKHLSEKLSTVFLVTNAESSVLFVWQR